MTGKEYVQQIKHIDTLIKNKTVDMKQARELGEDTAYIKNAIEQLKRTRKEIVENIQRLPEAQSDVLHRVYVQGESLYVVASERRISYSYATKLHGWALQALERIINK